MNSFQNESHSGIDHANSPLVMSSIRFISKMSSGFNLGTKINAIRLFHWPFWRGCPGDSVAVVLYCIMGRFFFFLSLDFLKLWGCAGDRVEMVVKVHCGTVLGDEFATMLKKRPPKQSHNALWQPSRPGLSRILKVANCFMLHKSIRNLYFNPNFRVATGYIATGRPKLHFGSSHAWTAAWFAQLGERRSAEREVTGSNPGRTNTQGL